MPVQTADGAFPNTIAGASSQRATRNQPESTTPKPHHVHHKDHAGTRRDNPGDADDDDDDDNLDYEDNEDDKDDDNNNEISPSEFRNQSRNYHATITPVTRTHATG